MIQFVLRTTKIRVVIKMTLSDFLKQKRGKLNLSLRQAADLIGISHGYLNKLETGYDTRSGVANKPTPNVVKLISKAYKTDYYDLLNICGYTEAKSENKKDALSPDQKELLKYYNACDELDKVRILTYAEAIAEKEGYNVERALK